MERNRVVLKDTYFELNVSGHIALFDLDDLWVCRYGISAADNGEGHIRLIFSSGELIGKYVARVLISTAPDRLIDHRNRNPLDNRKENLRHATRAINAQNAASHSDRADTSLPRGVDKLKNGKFRSRITVDGIRIETGRFDTAEAAAISYNNYAAMLRSGWHDGKGV